MKDEAANGDGKALPAITAAAGVVGVVTVSAEEYDRNPYLPMEERYERAEAAGVASGTSTLANIGAAVLAGAVAGVCAGGPVGVLAGAATGLAVSVFIYAIGESDLDRNGKTITEDYVDWRAEVARNREPREYSANGRTH